MVWKNLKQKSLAESMLIDHAALKELDEVHELIDWSRLEHMLSDIYASPKVLEKRKLMEPLLGEINQQLIEQGLYIKSGTVSIVDASVIEAKQCRPNKDKRGNSTQDPEANWNVKAGSDGKRKSTYGFKAHINVDEDGFIKGSDFTAGNVHDSNCFIDLLEDDESAVYADSAYCSKKHDERLAENEIENRLTKRAYRNRALTLEEKQFNQTHSGVRSTV